MEPLSVAPRIFFYHYYYYYYFLQALDLNVAVISIITTNLIISKEHNINVRIRDFPYCRHYVKIDRRNYCSDGDERLLDCLSQEILDNNMAGETSEVTTKYLDNIAKKISVNDLRNS